MRARWLIPGLLLALGPSLALAHGSVPAPATFTAPPRLVATVDDAGTRGVAAYTFATADEHYDVAFEDGDTDPLSHHDFYWLDHAPPLALDVTAVRALGTPVADVPAGIWAACSCPADFGAACSDQGMRDCRNGFAWDTHALAPGAYWLVAATHDPPFDVYTVSDGPVLVSHDGAPPPAVIVVRPDGFGTADATYRVRWLMQGTGSLHVDLSYAEDSAIRAGQPFTPLVTDAPLVQDADGTWGWDWDVSGLPSARIDHVRVTVRDASGIASHSDSRAGLTVYHPGTLPDLALPVVEPQRPGGCATVPAAGVGGLAGVALGALLLVAARRRT